MDACLVMTTVLNPMEVDKEAHNLDLTPVYPLEFYEASLKNASPKELEAKFDLVSQRLGSDSQYTGFRFSHNTGYRRRPQEQRLQDPGDNDRQDGCPAGLARLIRAVDEQDVAERVINSHFLPDLIGNLHAFSSRRSAASSAVPNTVAPPLRRDLSRYWGQDNSTVHEGSVRKYLDVSIKVAEEYGVSSYTKQAAAIKDGDRLLFKNDKARQTGLADFM